MGLVITVLQSGLLGWMGLLMLLVGTRILSGDINAQGLLSHRLDDQTVLPERALSMAVFPVVIVSYAYTALNTDISTGGPVRLPDVPESLLNLMIGTNGLYLAGKIARS